MATDDTLHAELERLHCQIDELKASVKSKQNCLDAALRGWNRATVALEEIANHPHCLYDRRPEEIKQSRDYDIGVTDGHRCAAKVAREALGIAGVEQDKGKSDA